MARPEDLRELLFADVALVDGHASARHVAAALLKYWERRERSDTTLQEELAKIAGLDASALARIEQEVQALVDGAGADAAAAITRRGGIAHELHAAVSRQDADVSRQLTSLGTGIRVRLRTLTKDRYLDFMPVGEGGMGIVYWAIDTELGRQVAFKVVRPPVEGPGAGITPPAPVRMKAPEGGSQTASAFEELKARFIQEAWVTGGMEHPGIVPIYELGQTEGGVPYYTMRFIRGRRTLEDAIREASSKTLEERLALIEPFLRVCDAVAYAHDRGVVHRDLKPANVALGEYGETMVIDWGLAKLAAQADAHASRWRDNIERFRDDTSMATMTSALGTPGYMAPEAALGEVEKVDALADVYSLGAILFEILAGRRHVIFENFREYAEGIVASDAPSPREIDDEVPEALATLCQGALARDRQVRPRHAGQLAKAIRAWQTTRASERELELRLAEARGARTEGEASENPDAMRAAAERIVLAVDRALTLRPGHAGAQELRASAATLQERARAREDAQARRALLRKIAIPVLVVLAAVAAVVASVIEGQRREAEAARAEAGRERDRAAEDRQRAEQALSFIAEGLHARFKPEGRLDVLAEIGEEARAHFAALPAAKTDPRTFTRRMTALGQLADVYLAQGKPKKARAVAEEASEASRREHASSLPAALAEFEHLRAQVTLARVDLEQGLDPAGNAAWNRVVEALGTTAPDGVTQRRHLETRVQALGVLARSYSAHAKWVKASEASDHALAAADRLLSLEDTSATDHLLRGELQLRKAWYFVPGGNDTEDPSEAALREAVRLRNVHPEDLLVRAHHARSLLARSVVLQRAGDWIGARGMAERAIAEARALVALRPRNAAWKGTLALALARLGETQSGAKLTYTQGREAYAEAYALLEELVALDPSSARWLGTQANMCDRLARPMGAPGTLPYRIQAVELARRRAALDPNNGRWRYLLSYTLGVLAAQFPKEPQSDLRLEEAYAIAGDVLTVLPEASDVYTHYKHMGFELGARIREPDARRAHYHAQLQRLWGEARRHPDHEPIHSRLADLAATIPAASSHLATQQPEERRHRAIVEHLDAVEAYLRSWMARAETSERARAGIEEQLRKFDEARDVYGAGGDDE